MRYKLTTQDMRTRPDLCNETVWEVGKWVCAHGSRNWGLCSAGYIHWYSDPLLAVLLNPIHANIGNPRLWEIETWGYEQADCDLKGGSHWVRLVKEIPLPTVTVEHRIRFMILCTMKVYHDTAWHRWANNWLSGKDRSLASATCAESNAALYAAITTFAYAASESAAAAVWYAAGKTVDYDYTAASVVDTIAFAVDNAADNAAAPVTFDLAAIAKEAVQ